MKRLILSAFTGIIVALLFLFAKNICFGKIQKPYGISGAVAMKNIDYLFLGSSCFRQGIDIKTLEGEGLENAFLLAFNGNEPVYEIAELRSLLSAGCSIKRIYIDMNPFIAQSEPSLSDVRILQDLDIETKQFLWNKIKSNKSNISTFYEFWCQANNEYFATYPMTSPLINSRYYKGGATDFKDGTTAEKLQKEADGVTLKDLNDEQLNGIRMINQLCRQNDIQLCFIEPLIYTGLQANVFYQKRIKEYESFLDKEHISYLLNDKITIDFSDATLFTNCNHASSKGRTVFAKALMPLLR